MIKVGTRVKYIHEDTEQDKAMGFYPPIGTCGTVVTVGSDIDIEVKWDSGTDDDGIWWCGTFDVDEVPMNATETLAMELAESKSCANLAFDDVCAIAQTVIGLGYARKEE